VLVGIEHVRDIVLTVCVAERLANKTWMSVRIICGHIGPPPTLARLRACPSPSSEISPALIWSYKGRLRGHVKLLSAARQRCRAALPFNLTEVSGDSA